MLNCALTRKLQAGRRKERGCGLRCEPTEERRTEEQSGDHLSHDGGLTQAAGQRADRARRRNHDDNLEKQREE